MFMGPRNWCQGMNSASLCSLAGRYENPIPPRCLAPIDFLKIPALIGAGINGSWAALQLARRGAKVILLEKVHFISTSKIVFDYYLLPIVLLVPSQWRYISFQTSVLSSLRGNINWYLFKKSLWGLFYQFGSKKGLFIFLHWKENKNICERRNKTKMMRKKKNKAILKR
jgi:hypothetical protein